MTWPALGVNFCRLTIRITFSGYSKVAPMSMLTYNAHVGGGEDDVLIRMIYLPIGQSIGFNPTG